METTKLPELEIAVGGSDRIELYAALSESELTPSLGLSGRRLRWVGRRVRFVASGHQQVGVRIVG